MIDGGTKMIPKVHFVLIISRFSTFKKTCEQYFLPPLNYQVSLFDSVCVYDTAIVNMIKFTPESPVPTVILRLRKDMEEKDFEDFKILAVEKGWGWS